MPILGQLGIIYVIITGAILSDRLATPATDATTGAVAGIVIDPSGNPAKDCVVTLQQANEKMREPLQATTDEKGAFTIENIPEGQYNLNVRTRDLRGKVIKTVSVIAGKTANVGKLKLKMK